MILENYASNECEKELLIATKNIVETGIGGNQSLCHGDIGNLEILRAIAAYNSDEKLKAFTDNYLQGLISRHQDGELFRTGEDGSIPLVNLFMGEAGIGYGLLRQYDWENVPSVLSLESSELEFKNLHKKQS